MRGEEPMRILVCNWRDITHPAHGGAEVYTHEVLTRWAQWGHEITLFCAASTGRPANETIDGIDHVRAGSKYSVYSQARQWWRKQGQHVGFDIVIDQVNTRPFACHKWVTGVPVVALVHQVAREVWFKEVMLPIAVAGRFMMEPYWLRSLRYVPAMTVSESSRQSLLDAGLQKVVIVPEGIENESKVLIKKYERPTAVFVGRLAANKRPDHAVAAVGLARQQGIDLRIKLVGEGDLKEELADRGSHVEALGFVSAQKRDDVVSRAHVQLVTSVREGWGLVVDEAARLGTKSIGYDVPGLRDSVPASGGILVEPRPEAVAQALVTNMTSLTNKSTAQGWQGGAVSWDTVAEKTFTTMKKISHYKGDV